MVRAIMARQTYLCEPDVLRLRASRGASAAGLARLYLQWSKELRWQAKADYYADFFIGAAVCLFSGAFFVAISAYFARLALDNKHALAVVMRCISWDVSALCLAILGWIIGAWWMRLELGAGTKGFLKWTVCVLIFSSAFGLIGVVPFAFI